MPRPTPSGFRVSRPLAVLLLPEPSGLVSCRCRSRVSPSGPFPLTEPLLPLGNSDLRGVGHGENNLQANSKIGLTVRLAFKALLSVRIRHLQRWGEPYSERPLPSWVSWPLGVSPLQQPAAYATDPLMSFTIGPDTRLSPPIQKIAALQGLDRCKVGWSTGDCRPFWSSCTSSSGRKFRVQPRLAYGFTPPS